MAAVEATGGGGVIYDVVIVGAGWAGLAASNYLIDAGITDNLLVVEARDRIGGRTHTLDNLFQDGYPVEEGSQWIYEGTYIFDLVNSLGIAHEPSMWGWDTLGLYEESVGPLSQEEQDRIINDVYRKQFIPYANKNAASDKDWIQLLSEFYQDRGDALSDTERQAINGMVTQGVIVEYGSPLNQTSSGATVGNLGRGDPWFSMDNMAVGGGTGGGYTAAITKGLADNLSSDQILLNAPVTKIDRTSTDGIVQIHTTSPSNSVIQARSVIVTVSVGVLKQPSSIEFLPALSSKKLRAIDTIGMGVLNKVILYWDGTTQDVSWWPKGQVDMELITKEDLTSDDFTYFYNENEQGANSNYYTLTAFSGGKPAELLESKSDEELIELVLKNTREMFGAGVPSPNKNLISRWYSDEYAKGAYSFDLVGTDAQKLRTTLAEPVGTNLYFAGEAADTNYWYSTTQGAYSTGIKASNSIAESGILGSSNELLQPSCTALNQECDKEGQLPCCKGTVCAPDRNNMFKTNMVCTVSTAVYRRPGSPADSEPDSSVSVLSEDEGNNATNDDTAEENETNEEEESSSSSILIFSAAELTALIGFTTTLMTFVMTISDLT